MLGILIFFLIALAILYFSHYLLFCSVVYFFHLSGTGQRLTLAVILFLLPTSFVVAEIISRRGSSRLFNAFFFSSTLWLGIGLTLLTTFLAAWIVWGGLHLFKEALGAAWLGWAAVALACALSGWGVWNAYHPRVREVHVRIRNLPAAWQGRRIAQLSDVHLGHIHGAAFLRDLVERTNAWRPDMVVITGDLFDGADGRLEDLVRPLDGLEAPLGVYFVTGNHETYLGVERAYAALRTTRTRILNDERVLIDGLQIVGIAYPQRMVRKDLGKAIQAVPGYDPQAPSLLLYHSPTQVDRIKAAGLNLQLSGHTHQGQIFPIQFISRLVYGKYYHGLHVEGDYAIYTSSGAGTWGPTMRTGNRPEIALIELEGGGAGAPPE